LFLPITKTELIEENLRQSRHATAGSADFVCITGDAYVDHPSFGIAIVSRILESLGFTVGIIAQPVTDADFTELGEPRYCFMVSGGNIDSMVANYTVSGKRRYKDDYSPGGSASGEAGLRTQALRPDYAVTEYCKTLKRIYPDTGIVIGGLEASLRRFAHYDYWTDMVGSKAASPSAILPSVLISSGADLLIYGMAELTIIQLAERLRSGEVLSDITDLHGTCYTAKPIDTPLNAVQCDSFELVRSNKKCYAKACAIQYIEQNGDRTIVQRHGDVMLVQNPPQRPLTESEMDKVYALPFMRKYHPIYEKQGGVPAIREVEFSITWTRGCFGKCNFCSIALHQGKKIQTRSEQSIVDEAQLFVKNPGFKGYIHDVGGPTANFGQSPCENPVCKNKKCLSPELCKNLVISHEKYLTILRRLRGLKGIKKVFIRSGIRYDYVMADRNKEFLNELVEHHVSGQLKVAPEHSRNNVLDCMGKPHIEAYERFSDRFAVQTKRCGKEQYLIPYLMSSHPGSTLADAVELALWLKKHNIRPEQVQDFYPTPGTVSTAMYYTGLDPFTLKEVYVAKSPDERAMQRALLQYYKAENRELVIKALTIIKRRDLIEVLLGVSKNAEKQPAFKQSEKAKQQGNKKHSNKKATINKIAKAKKKKKL